MNKKDIQLDSVELMRKIRRQQYNKYKLEPDQRKKDLIAIRKKYKLKESTSSEQQA